MGKRIATVILALLLMVSSAGCGGSSTDEGDGIPTSSAGKDIEKTVGADNVFSLNSNSKYSFNPLIATNHSNQLICSLVYEYLVEVDNDFNVIEGAGLATEWTVSDDGKSWVITIDATHVFHDGTEVTANDVRHSIEYAINSDRYQGRFGNVAGVSYSSDQVFITLNQGNKRFIKLLNIPIIKFGTYGEKYPTGSGPYTYNEEHTELQSFAGHNGYEDLPVDTIYIKEYKSADEIIAAYENSIIDVAVNDPTSLTDLGYASSNEFRLMSTSNMHYVAFNQESLVCKYSSFRAAMQYAFDRNNLANALLQGNGVAASVPMYPTCSDYPTSFASSLDYNLNKCVTILSNMGIRDYDEDGRLEFMNGTAVDFELNFIVCSDSSAKTGVVNRFASDMESIGIKVNVRELVWEEYLEALENGDFDMYYAEVKLRNDFDITRIIAVRDEDNEATNINYTKSTNKFYQDYLNAYLAASDIDSKSKFLEFCKYMSEDPIIVPLGFERQQMITHRGVIKGVEANIGDPMYNFANWKIDLS